MALPQNQETPNDETLPIAAPRPAIRSWRDTVDGLVWTLAWVVVSAGIILNSKWVFTTGGFPYPLALTCTHMLCCTTVFGSIRHLAPRRVKLAIMPDAEKPMTWEAFAKKVLTISFFFGVCLGASQTALLFATVPFCQMMKPLNIIFASLSGFAIGTEVPTASHIIIVCITLTGIFTATSNSLEFSLIGCLLQVLASATEGARLAFVQSIMSSDDKVDPVSTVYYYSFPCAIFLACATFAVEWPISLSKLLSPWVLIVNCTIAVVLNVLIATVIKKTSAVAFTMAGVGKDIGIVLLSVVMFQSQISRLTMSGYMVALSGICMYKVYKDNLELFKERGFFSAMSYVVRSSIEGKAIKA